VTLRFGFRRSVLPLFLGAITLTGTAGLLVQDAFPGVLAAVRHDVLEAFALALIAIAYLVYQALRRPALLEWVKAAMLAAAFLFWAANQVWSNVPVGTVFNDVAIGLFVLDVFLMMANGRAAPEDGDSAGTGGDAER
jgi:hypothetical protein